jgi:GNAT acetyltransferase-like protein
VTGLVEIDSLEWDGLLEKLGCADAYLLRLYVESACVLDPGRSVLLHLGDRCGDVVFPAIVREVPGGARDVTTPYGYGGPVATGPDPPTARFWSLYQAWCEENGVVTSFVRFHPLFANQRSAPGGVHVEPLSSTVGWRLRVPDLFDGMHEHHRRTCRKARRAGVAVTARESPAELSAFASLYQETIGRVGAREFYFFSPPYWEALTRLGTRLVLFDAEVGGEVVASALCFATHPWLHFHLGATAERGRAVGAGNLVFYEAACWARDLGYERFHLGGGVGGRDDSLLMFKRRFDPGGLVECAVGKAVHDAAAYRRLAGRAADDIDGFFPAYRR